MFIITDCKISKFDYTKKNRMYSMIEITICPASAISTQINTIDTFKEDHCVVCLTSGKMSLIVTQCSTLLCGNFFK